jgi:RNA polymerase sigma-70 factor (ECF subfamily)
VDGTDAVSQLYADNRPWVFRFFYLRVRNASDAEDLTHDVFVKALRNLDGFTDDGRGYGPWLQTITTRVFLDFRKSARFEREGLCAEFYADEPMVWGREPDNPATLAERHAVVDVLPRLSAPQAKCLTLRFLLDLDVCEAARVMGIKDSALRALQYRATCSARRHLEGARP